MGLWKSLQRSKYGHPRFEPVIINVDPILRNSEMVSTGLTRPSSKRNFINVQPRGFWNMSTLLQRRAVWFSVSQQTQLACKQCHYCSLARDTRYADTCLWGRGVVLHHRPWARHSRHRAKALPMLSIQNAATGVTVAGNALNIPCKRWAIHWRSMVFVCCWYSTDRAMKRVHRMLSSV